MIGLNFAVLKKKNWHDTIAHEIAHTVLHTGCDGGSKVEEEADNLSKEWGFKGTYTKKQLQELQALQKLKNQKNGN